MEQSSKVSEFKRDQQGIDKENSYWKQIIQSEKVSNPSKLDDFVKNYKLGMPNKNRKKQKIGEYSTMRLLFAGIAKHATSNSYEYNDHNVCIIPSMIKWFTHDDSGDFNLNKGIMICGSVGVGKTHLFKIFQTMVDTFNDDIYKFKIVKCPSITKEIDDDFKNKKPSLLKTFYRDTYLFDDIGSEPLELKVYGNSVSVMSDIIFERESRHEGFGLISHFTTNLTPKELEVRYGTRIWDRLKKMCNIVVVEQQESFRK